MCSIFYICSSLDKVLRKIEVPDGGATSRREPMFYKGKMYWLYLNRDYEEYPTYWYIIYWLDVLKNKWSMSYVLITNIRCMSLAL
jgi:hypothetical protein